MQTKQLRKILLIGFFLSLLSCGDEKDTTNPTISPPGNNNLTGAQLYASNCESCHGSLNNSAKRGKSATAITQAIVTESQMSHLKGILSEQQINKIAEALQQ